jgi:hypothetical protein
MLMRRGQKKKNEFNEQEKKSAWNDFNRRLVDGGGV